MSEVPAVSEGRRHRRRHRRQLSGRAPRPAGLDRHGPARQGPAAQPGRLDRPRLELHLPGRPQQGDGAARRAERQPVPRRRAQRRLRRHRGRPHPGADGRVRAPHDLGHGLGRRGRAAHPGRGQGTRPVHQRRRHPRRLLLPDRVGRRLARHRHAVAQRGHREDRPAGVRQHRGARRRDRRRARHRPAEGHRRRHRQGPHRGRVRRDRLWRVVEPDRQHGRRHDPARARRAPDGRRRPDGHARRDQQRDRLPDRPRHGHVLLRAPVVGLDGGRLVRPPPDPPPPRRHPVERRGRALARPRCRSPPTTSTSRWKRPSS